MHLCRHHCRRRSVAQLSQLCPPRCAETHSTGSHSAANRRAVPRHSSSSKWRRWYTVTASSSRHSTRSWISLLPRSRLAERAHLTVLLTGPRERVAIPSSSRNFFLQRTIEQLLEVEVPQRIEAAIQRPKVVHHDGFQQRTSKQIMDSLSPQIPEGTVEVIAVGASRTHSVVQRKRRSCSEPSSSFSMLPVPQRIARRSTLLSSVSWRVSTGMRLLVRSDIVQHPAWYTQDGGGGQAC